MAGFNNGEMIASKATVDNLQLDVNSISATNTNGNINLVPKGTGKVSAPKLEVDNLQLDGNTLASLDTNGDINLTPNGTGKVNITGLNVVEGALAINQLQGGNLKLSSNALESVNTNGDINITPNGTGKVNIANPVFSGAFSLGGNITPTLDVTYSVGSSTLRYNEVWAQNVRLGVGSRVTSYDLTLPKDTWVNITGTAAKGAFMIIASGVADGAPHGIFTACDVSFFYGGTINTVQTVNGYADGTHDGSRVEVQWPGSGGVCQIRFTGGTGSSTGITCRVTVIGA